MSDRESSWALISNTATCPMKSNNKKDGKFLSHSLCMEYRPFFFVFVNNSGWPTSGPVVYVIYFT